jgi:hypothetical protein
MLRIYEPFQPQEVSDKAERCWSSPEIKAEVKIIFQTVEDLHTACPKIGIGTLQEITHQVVIE